MKPYRFFALKKDFKHPFKVFKKGTVYSPAVWVGILGLDMSVKRFLKLVKTHKRFSKYFEEII